MTQSEVSIVKCFSYDENEVSEAIAKSLSNLGGIEKFVKPSQKVLLKVNALMGLAPEKACTTHPAVVKAVAKLVLKAGGIPFIADEPGSFYGGTDKIYEICGFKKVAEELGIEIKSLKEHGAELIKPSIFTKLSGEIPISKLALESDVIINLPKLKTHMLTVFTGAVKNMFGTVPGHHKSKFHFEFSDPDDFSRILVEIYNATKPALNIMDAAVSMEGQGPSYGNPKKTSMILASTDGVALDSVAAYLIGYSLDEVPTTKLADEKNVGQGDISKIKILGSSIDGSKVKGFKKGRNFYALMKKIPKFIMVLLNPIFSLIKTVPVIDKKKCTACQTCVKICPANAMKIVKNKSYLVDRKKCIICFCCYETCPNKAIKLTRNILKGF